MYERVTTRCAAGNVAKRAALDRFAAGKNGAHSADKQRAYVRGVVVLARGWRWCLRLKGYTAHLL